MTASYQWRVPKAQAGERLLQFLREHCKEAPSVKALKRAIDHKLCTVNGQIQTFSSYLLKEKDSVSLRADAFEKQEHVEAKVLYEDEAILLLHKPSGLVSEDILWGVEISRFCRRESSENPSMKKGAVEKNTAPFFIEGFTGFDVAKTKNLNAPQYKELKKRAPHLIHRLDKETSGVLILAKTQEAKKYMLSLFKEHAIRKAYLAIVDGSLEKEAGTIDNYLGKRGAYEGQTLYGKVDKHKGQRAITHWKRLSQGKTASLVYCEPQTGRTHQLRVHLSEMGHPILGDRQYSRHFRCSFHPKRNLLHAYSVQFKHPVTGKLLKVVAPIPIDFKEALDVLKLPLKRTE